MKIKNLHLKNFRNYKDLSLSFKKNIIAFLGNNAQGKTNLIESIYVLGMTRSHRTKKESQLIQIGEQKALVSCCLQKKHSSILLDMLLVAKGRKICVNHIEQKKLSSYIGKLNVIIFSPEDLSLIQGGPQLRRNFLDIEIGQIDSFYLRNLLDYKKILKQRNFYFKQLNLKNREDAVLLDILSQQLVDVGSRIILTRKKFIKRLNFLANQIQKKMSQEKENLKISYQSTISFKNKNISLEEIKKSFLDNLLKIRNKERIQQQTLIGPHRDDLLFLVNNVDVRFFGSQGQKRSIILSIKLAEMDLMKEKVGEYPILLLDDVMSELDHHRQVRLFKLCERKGQTFLTSTTLDHMKNQFDNDIEIFNISDGDLKGEKTIWKK